MVEVLEQSPVLPLKEDDQKLHLHPCAIVIAGLPLSGKTTLATALVDRIDRAVLLDVDQARKDLESRTPLQTVSEKEIMECSYEENHQRALKAHQKGQIPILTATYSREAYHEQLLSLQKSLGVDLFFIQLPNPDDSLPDRLHERNTNGDSSNVRTVEHFQSVKDRYEPFTNVSIKGIGLIPHLTKDQMVQATLKSLEDLKDNQEKRIAA